MPEPVGGAAEKSSQGHRPSTKLAWGGSRAGASGSAREGRPRWSRMARTTRGAVMEASTRLWPPTFAAVLRGRRLPAAVHHAAHLRGRDDQGHRGSALGQDGSAGCPRPELAVAKEARELEPSTDTWSTRTPSRISPPPLRHTTGKNSPWSWSSLRHQIAHKLLEMPRPEDRWVPQRLDFDLVTPVEP